MVDVQEQHLSGRRLNGKEKKRRLLHGLVGKFVTLISNEGTINGEVRYEASRKGAIPGCYVGNRRVLVSEVHRIYPSQNRIELYDSSQKRSVQ